MPFLSSLGSSLAALATPRIGLLLLLLAAAAVIDVRSYRIPNALTVAGMLLGIAANALESPDAAAGAMRALGGIGVALLCLLPLHAFHLIGGGDVKLMAAVGAFLGLPDLLPAMLFVFAAAGLLSLGYAAVRGIPRSLLSNAVFALRAALATTLGTGRTAAARPPSAGRLPYGLCIGLGTAAFLLVRQALAA